MPTATALTPLANHSPLANYNTTQIDKLARQKDIVRLNGNRIDFSDRDALEAAASAEGAAAYIDALDRLACGQAAQIKQLTEMLRVLGHYSPSTGFVG